MYVIYNGAEVVLMNYRQLYDFTKYLYVPISNMYRILVSVKISCEVAEVQLNEYETAPYFLQLSQRMTIDCLFTFVFFPILT
jgi:hypothetical protein